MLAGAGIAGRWGRRASRHRLGPDRGRSLAGARRSRPCAAPTGCSRCRSRAIAPGHAAALSAGRRAMALSARPARLGACLADDMGLGKTIQVLSLLLVLKNEREPGHERKPCLLVAPASLLANWAAEIARFAPSLKAVVAHPSAAPAEKLEMDGSDDLGGGRSGHHELRLSDAHAVACDDTVATGGARRGAGHQEPGRQADQNGQAAAGRRAHRPDRHADREPARRPVVDLRLHQSRTAGIVEASFRPSSNASPTGRRTPTARSATWCAPISCGA